MPPVLAVAAAVVGAGATVYSAVNAKKQANRAANAQRKANKQQEEDAKIAIQNEAALARNDTDKIGADISFGTGASDEVLKRGAGRRKSAKAGSGAAKVGGTGTTAVGGL